jgi:hypothetical protein
MVKAVKSQLIHGSCRGQKNGWVGTNSCLRELRKDWKWHWI